MTTAPRWLLAICTALLAGCRPDRLPGEETIEEQMASIATTSTGESATLSGDALLGRIGQHHVTLGDFERRVGMLPAVARVMFDTDARRAELLDLMIRVEVMALEAQRVGLAEGRDERWRVREMLLRRWIAETLAVDFDPTQVPEDELQRRFERDAYLYTTPELRRARILLVGTREEAEGVQAELRAGVEAGEEPLSERFARIAGERSLHAATRDRGGDAGWTASIATGASGNAALLQAVFDTPPGELAAAPVEVADGWLFVLVERRADAVERTAADYEWLLPQRIVEERTAAAARSALDGLRVQLAPQIDEPMLAALRSARVDAPGDDTPRLPRRFDTAGLAELPARYVGEDVIASLADPPPWRVNPHYAFAAPLPREGSGAAAPEVPE